MGGIKNLIFDFGGVIINLTRNRCIEEFAQLGVDVHEQLEGYNHKELFMQLELGAISAAEFRDGIRKRSNLPITDAQIDKAWINMLDDVPSTKLDILLDLHQKYNLYLLSNTNTIHWEWAEKKIFSYKNHTINDFFHKIYLSFELHLLKPNAEIYEYVLQDAGLRPEETLFIDDALVNCKAAEALGIHTYNAQPREEWTFLSNERELL
ncbi:HAD superfamily hydrolase (TIGR01509 family) [Parabacteroides sp. PFB2-12]|uniref:HAD family hydrolase n=1 Tax=unclassified Parabacteroides TaxID=2649774 RepID=UPI002474E48A|nr:MULTISPECIES: HAD family phosphatase [unclassified Parabacteroides]MDH6343663.1 HAD superfamily hydrolase (TIGR01509 family) [Parabacteroides sp. PM6-13]MDH6391299.1 HAD superfamily hydrolase (TIGR01509 family) [Parabacteroides sp. PFB2-12]